MAKKTSSAGKIVAGVGLAALAAAAAAGYYFSGPKSAKHKKQLKDWGKKAKTEMLHKIKHMKTVSAQSYHQAAAEVMAKYKQAKNIDPSELAALGQELKGHWDGISKALAEAGKTTTKSKAAKKAHKVKGKK